MPLGYRIHRYLVAHEMLDKRIPLAIDVKEMSLSHPQGHGAKVQCGIGHSLYWIDAKPACRA
jgi:hypothetical protein